MGTVGTNAGSGEVKLANDPFDQLRQYGKLYLSGKDFKDVFIVKQKVWINMMVTGNAASIATQYFISGQYVKLDKKVVDELKQGVSLT